MDRILLVDDHIPNLTVLEACLMPLRCEMLRATTGRQALDVFLQERVDLVLLDLMMPDLDGIEVLRRIRERGDLPYVPVVLVTARREREDRLRGLEAGADEFLEKPVDRAILVARVRALLRAKRTQETLAARDRALQSAELERGTLRRAVRARDDFLSLASHELKTPLTSLRLNLDVLRRHGHGGGDAPAFGDWARARVDALDRGLRRLESLVAHLLDASRISSSGVVLHAEATDLVEVVADSVKRFAEAIALSGCELQVSLDEPIVGSWDRVRLTSIVDNLVSNAIKYGAGKPIEVAAARTASGVELSVRDHGIGIAPEDHARIFEQFERAVPDGHYSGFGLGLWIARTTVAAMGGALRVSSRPAEGATFVVELPLQAAPPARAAAGGTG